MHHYLSFDAIWRLALETAWLADSIASAYYTHHADEHGYIGTHTLEMYLTVIIKVIRKNKLLDDILQHDYGRGRVAYAVDLGHHKLSPQQQIEERFRIYLYLRLRLLSRQVVYISPF